MTFRDAACIAAVVLALAAPSDVRANWESVEAALENDRFAHASFLPFDGDSNFTNGARVSWWHEGDEAFWHLRRVVGLYSSLTDCTGACTAQTGYSVTHAMYTPDSLQVSHVRLDDQPYVGLLSIDFLVEVRRPTSLHSLALQAGFMGPATGAQLLQEGIHKATGKTRPKGWSNQLKFEPNVGLSYSYQQMREIIGDLFYVIPTVGGSIGTRSVFGSIGASVRIGGGDALSLSPLVPSTLGNGNPFLFAGGDIRGIVYQLPLDGNLIRDPVHSVESNPLIYTLRLGAAAKICGLKLRYTYHVWGEQFDKPSSVNDKKDDWGTLAVELPL